MKNCPIYIKAIYAGWLEIFFIKPDFPKQIDRDLLRLGAKNKKKEWANEKLPDLHKSDLHWLSGNFFKKRTG
jgi:hypothetical protein